MSKKIQEKAKAPAKVTPQTKVDMVFGKQNYLMTGIAFLIVLVGFLLMYGGKEDIFSFRKITLAPIVVICGFIFGVFAIMYKPKTIHGAD